MLGVKNASDLVPKLNITPHAASQIEAKYPLKGFDRITGEFSERGSLGIRRMEPKEYLFLTIGQSFMTPQAPQGNLIYTGFRMGLEDAPHATLREPFIKEGRALQYQPPKVADLDGLFVNLTGTKIAEATTHNWTGLTEVCAAPQLAQAMGNPINRFVTFLKHWGVEDHWQEAANAGFVATSEDIWCVDCGCKINISRLSAAIDPSEVNYSFEHSRISPDCPRVKGRLNIGVGTATIPTRFLGAPDTLWEPNWREEMQELVSLGEELNKLSLQVKQGTTRDQIVEQMSKTRLSSYLDRSEDLFKIYNALLFPKEGFLYLSETLEERNERKAALKAKVMGEKAPMTVQREIIPMWVSPNRPQRQSTVRQEKPKPKQETIVASLPNSDLEGILSEAFQAFEMQD